MTEGPRTNSAPSPSAHTSVPGSGLPTEPASNAGSSLEIALTRGEHSVSPYWLYTVTAGNDDRISRAVGASRNPPAEATYRSGGGPAPSETSRAKVRSEAGTEERPWAPSRRIAS